MLDTFLKLSTNERVHIILLVTLCILGSNAVIVTANVDDNVQSGRSATATSNAQKVYVQQQRSSNAKTRQLLSGVTGKGDDVQITTPWTYNCKESVCKKEIAGGQAAKVSLDVCWITCGKYGPLWPFPTITTTLGTETVALYPRNVEIIGIYAPTKPVEAMLGYAGNVFLDYLYRLHPKSDGQAEFPQQTSPQHKMGADRNVLHITINSSGDETKFSFSTDESYTLKISSVQRNGGIAVSAEIIGNTFFGVRHGLETLGQLIAFDEENECLQVISGAVIEDRPVFRYRGLMIDTARNFIPIQDMKKMVDGMSYNKLNVLHWHLTDSNSFPFYSKRIPHMTAYGAYSPTSIYTPKDVKDLILYARLRGIKVIPELDAPAHAGNGWQWGSLMGLGDLALCVNSEPWRVYCGQPPCGQLNPLNNYTFLVLGELYKDFLEAFDNDVFHMGNDEVFFQCWNSRKEIREWVRSQGVGLMDLWGAFQQKAYARLVEANKGQYITPIVWTSDMTNKADGRIYLPPEDYIIQVWTEGTSYEVRELLQNNYRIIFSNVDALYFDHGYGSWLGTDHIYALKSWQTVYDNDIVKLAEHHIGPNATYYAVTNGQILGGEGTLWSEKVDQYNMEMKLWPRGAALAERLWSSPQHRSYNVFARILHHRRRMVDRGIAADRLQPESCHQITGYCHDPNSRI